MQNKIVLITGSTNGIGKQTALALARQGAHIIVTGRSPASGEAAIAELRRASGNSQVDLVLGDLATRAGVRSVAEQVTRKYPRLDVLVNNAGLAAPQRRLTEDGVEAMFAVNVIAPLLLSHLLMDSLKASPAGRIVSLTGGEHPAAIDLDNLQSEKSFVGLTAYSHTKLVMMAVMYDYARRTAGATVTNNVCYPGQAATSMTRGVTREMLPGPMRLIFPVFKWVTRPDGGKSAAKASQSSVYLAASPEVEGVSGQYFNSKAKQVGWPAPVLDAAARARLWAVATQLAQLSQD